MRMRAGEFQLSTVEWVRIQHDGAMCVYISSRETWDAQYAGLGMLRAIDQWGIRSQREIQGELERLVPTVGVDDLQSLSEFIQSLLRS